VEMKSYDHTIWEQGGTRQNSQHLQLWQIFKMALLQRCVSLNGGSYHSLCHLSCKV